MNKILAGVVVGRKNIGFGVALFLILGVAIGLPLTVDMLGGSMLTDSQYQSWKVLHAYGVFLAFVNFFFGFCVDRLNVGQSQKEIASWAFIVAGFAGAIGRSTLLLLGATGGVWSYAFSMIETFGFVIGTFIFIRGQLSETRENPIERPLNRIIH